MLIKIKNFLWTKNYYKIIIIIIGLNAIFELVFKYRFQTKIEIVYFFIAIFISVVMIKNIVGSKTDKYLPVFYCLWPLIILFISFISFCKFVLLPFLVSSFIIVICGKFKRIFFKIIVLIGNITLLSMYLLFWWAYYFILNPNINNIDTVYSPDYKYVMVVEETNFFTGGQVYVYFGRNIDFGVLGHYVPIKEKYYGNTDARPEIQFIDDDFISINGQLIETKGSNYIDDYH